MSDAIKVFSVDLTALLTGYMRLTVEAANLDKVFAYQDARKCSRRDWEIDDVVSTQIDDIKESG